MKSLILFLLAAAGVAGLAGCEKKPRVETVITPTDLLAAVSATATTDERYPALFAETVTPKKYVTETEYKKLLERVTNLEQRESGENYTRKPTDMIARIQRRKPYSGPFSIKSGECDCGDVIPLERNNLGLTIYRGKNGETVEEIYNSHGQLVYRETHQLEAKP